ARARLEITIFVTSRERTSAASSRATLLEAPDVVEDRAVGVPLVAHDNLRAPVAVDVGGEDTREIELARRTQRDRRVALPIARQELRAPLRVAPHEREQAVEIPDVLGIVEHELAQERLVRRPLVLERALAAHPHLERRTVLGREREILLAV